MHCHYNDWWCLLYCGPIYTQSVVVLFSKNSVECRLDFNPSVVKFCVLQMKNTVYSCCLWPMTQMPIAIPPVVVLSPWQYYDCMITQQVGRRTRDQEMDGALDCRSGCGCITTCTLRATVNLDLTLLLIPIFTNFYCATRWWSGICYGPVSVRPSVYPCVCVCHKPEFCQTFHQAKTLHDSPGNPVLLTQNVLMKFQLGHP